VICRKYSIQKLTQCSQGNNVLDDFLSRDLCFSSTYLKRLIWSNRAYLYLETTKLQKVFLSKTYSILTGGNVVDVPASNRDFCRGRDTCVSSPQMNGLFGLITLKTHIERSIPFEKQLNSHSETMC
jgi:hypothetical protein